MTTAEIAAAAQKGAPLSAENVLVVLSTTGFEYTDDLWWRQAEGGEHLALFVPCNDVFAWGCADVEEVTDANVGALVECYRQCEEVFGRYKAIWAGALFCARQRRAPVQSAFAELLDRTDPRWGPLFAAASEPAVPPPREPGVSFAMTTDAQVELREAIRARTQADLEALRAGSST